MKVYEGKDVHNIGITGHGDCGKTSLVASFLYTAGVTTRLTAVDEGNTLTDFDEEEIARKVTVTSSPAYAEWEDSKLNFIDTPGYNIFINDTKGSLIATDTTLVVIDGVSGVEVQTEKVWGYAEEYGLARMILVNKLDRERADFSRTLTDIQKVLGRGAIPVQIPIGAEKNFCGIVDLIEQKAYAYEPGGKGKGTETDIPDNLSSEVESARESLIEMVAECDDDLLNEYLEELVLPPEKILAGLRKGIIEKKLFPVLCGSATQNIGTDLILSFLKSYAASPVTHQEVSSADGEASRKIDDGGPLSLFVYKTSADPFAGRVTYFKVVSGVLNNDDNVFNFTRTAPERFARIAIASGKELTPVTSIHAGDLGAIAKLKETLTGDSLGDKSKPIQFPKAKIPSPAIAYAIQPKTRQDEDRLSGGINKILQEDQALNFYRDPQTQEFLLAGNGQQHLEIIVSRLKKRYNVEVELKAPKIPYRETIRGRAEVQGRHKKQSGGHGQFGDCRIRMEPLERGQKFEFVNSIFGGSIPKNYIPAVEKGIREAAATGYLAGYPVVDFKVELYDGQYHDVDSSELAFKLAGRKAFRAAMEKSSPALLEPIMIVEIVAPSDFAGDIMGDMNSRRGRIQGMDSKGSNQIVRAQVPMAEMLTYANELTSMTQGRGSFSMEFGHYDFVPQQIAEKVIAVVKRDHGGADEEDE